MCTSIIIDRNVSSGFTKPRKSNENTKSKKYADIQLNKFINRGDFIVIYSNKSKWKQEIIDSWKDELEILREAGKAKLSTEDLSPTINKLKNLKELKSDDTHILALAQITNTGILYTNDENLKIDFQNRKIMKNRGKLYPSESKDKIIDNFLNKHKCLDKN